MTVEISRSVEVCRESVEVSRQLAESQQTVIRESVESQQRVHRVSRVSKVSIESVDYLW